ncbi:shikimate kinase [Alphaproteobacteria bacterium]|nr:shikimate kinase [Alphaproteobacteria bacterium]
MIEKLECFHPLVIEGMGGYDPRDPAFVASQIIRQLANRWSTQPPSKPLLLITQGDPYEERGISAITRLVADELDISRVLIFLDPSIADYHAPNADRYKVIFEIPYSKMADTIQTNIPGVFQTIEEKIDTYLANKNAKRVDQGKPSLRDYYRDFALLQEVTKVACKQICDGITVAHTSREISEFSVSSFYEVGLDLGLINESEIVSYLD